MLDVVAFIYIQNRKVLVVRSHDKDRFYFTGGKRQPGESDVQVIYREVKEEIDAEVDLFSLNHLDSFEAAAHGLGEGKSVKMVCYTGLIKGQIKISSEIKEYKWILSDEMAICAPATQIAINKLKERDLID